LVSGVPTIIENAAVAGLTENDGIDGAPVLKKKDEESLNSHANLRGAGKTKPLTRAISEGRSARREHQRSRWEHVIKA